MLRALVALLLLANLCFWAWSAGALEGIGLAPARERDPTRLTQQIQPEAVHVLTPAAAVAAMRAASAASAPKTPVAFVCLEAGPFESAAIEAAEQALAEAALPDGSWVRTTHDIATQFAVVLGPFSTRDELQRKREELGRLRLPFEILDLPGDGTSAAPQSGLALGRYDSRIAADGALASLGQRGARGGRVIVLRPASSQSRIRFENATPAQAAQLRALNSAALGAGFWPCAVAAATR